MSKQIKEKLKEVDQSGKSINCLALYSLFIVYEIVHVVENAVGIIWTVEIDIVIVMQGLDRSWK